MVEEKDVYSLASRLLDVEKALREVAAGIQLRGRVSRDDLAAVYEADMDSVYARKLACDIAGASLHLLSCSSNSEIRREIRRLNHM